MIMIYGLGDYLQMLESYAMRLSPVMLKDINLGGTLT
jgi:hypothetical protein